MEWWDVVQTAASVAALAALASVWWHFSRTPRFGVEIRIKDITRYPDDGLQRIEVSARIEGPMVVYDFEAFAYGDAEIEVQPQRLRRADAASEPLIFTVKAPFGAHTSGYGLKGLDYNRWRSRAHSTRFRMSPPGEDPSSESWRLHRVLWLRYLWWRLRRKPKDRFQVGRWVPTKPWPYDAAAIPTGHDD